jgi:beta-lactamase class A
MSLNSEKKFSMYSVAKFFVALYIFHRIDQGYLTIKQKILYSRDDLQPILYSPLRDEFPEEVELTLGHSLEYPVTKSDNNVFDKLIEIIGGVDKINCYKMRGRR